MRVLKRLKIYPELKATRDRIKCGENCILYSIKSEFFLYG